MFIELLDALMIGANREETAEALNFDLAEVRFRPESIFIAGTSGEVAKALADVTGLKFSEVERALRSVGSGARQLPAVPLVPCLGALRQGHSLGLVTNDDEASARVHLAQEGVLDLFDFVAGFDSGHGAKPEPGQLLAFCEATGAKPQATLMVGDSRHDLAAGRVAGMRTVGVLTGVAGAGELADLADVVLPDIGHLQAWIKAEANRA